MQCQRRTPPDFSFPTGLYAETTIAARPFPDILCTGEMPELRGLTDSPICEPVQARLRQFQRIA
jgi:hypothetical protein